MGQIFSCLKYKNDQDYLNECYRYNTDSEIILCHECLGYKTLYCRYIGMTTKPMNFCSQKCYNKYKK